MNKQQKIFNILAKAQEPMKVDLALAQNIDKYVKAANDYQYAGAKQYSELMKIYERKEDLMRELADAIQDGERQYSLLEKELRDFQTSAKELGVDPSSSNIYKRGLKAQEVLQSGIKGWKGVYKQFK